MENKTADLFEFAAFDKLESEHIAAPRYSYWKSVWRTFFRSKFTVAVSILMIALVAFALIQPLYSGYSPTVAPNINNADMKFLKPSAEHPFGTDNIGNEVFDAVWAGARNSIIVSFVCTGINMLIGVLVGAIWGFSKKVDKWMIEVYNVIANIPFLLMAMILSYVLGAGMRSLIITMTCTNWIYVAYFIRTQVMIIRDREYNMASKCLGTGTWTIITKNVLPYLVSVIMTYISREIPSIISYEVFLSYLGLGLGTTNASLGRMISMYTSYMQGYPHLFWIPVSVVAIISISLYIVGQRLADATDPRTHM
ncbi:MAG: ABC transporter permease [Oscillospiraceae bacterium]|nr:ABC transporter permease [Oscillospiraceae bacterium]